MLRYSGSVKKGEGIAGHKTANNKVFIKFVVHNKKTIENAQKKKNFLLNMPSGNLRGLLKKGRCLNHNSSAITQGIV